MYFEVKMMYQKEDIAALQRGMAVKKYRGKPISRFFSLYGFYILAFFLISIPMSAIATLLTAWGITITWKFAVVIAILALIVTIYDQWGNRQRIMSWLSWRRVKKGLREVTEYQFFEEDFWARDSKSETRSSYSIFEDIIEGPDHYLLFISKNLAHVLNKKSFLAGDPNAFGPWISQKTGKEITKMR